MKPDSRAGARTRVMMATAAMVACLSVLSGTAPVAGQGGTQEVAGLVEPGVAPVPGFYPAPDIDVTGSDHRLRVSSPLACQFVEAWLGSGDWSLDGHRVARVKRQRGQPALPTMRWSVLSAGPERVVARLAAWGDGCAGTITRFSRQPFAASGPVALAGEAIAYPLMCFAAEGRVQLAMVYELPGQGMAFLGFETAIALGEHRVAEASGAVGERPFDVPALLSVLAGSNVAAQGLRALARGMTPFEARRPGTVEISSVEPLQGVLRLPDLTVRRRPGSLEVGFRCDLPRGAVPEPGSDATQPSVLGESSLALTIGSGADAVVLDQEAPESQCQSGTPARGDLTLVFAPGFEGAEPSLVYLVVPRRGKPMLQLMRTATGRDLSIGGSYGGRLEASATDEGPTMRFEATGRTKGGVEISLSAVCSNVTARDP